MNSKSKISTSSSAATTGAHPDTSRDLDQTPKEEIPPSFTDEDAASLFNPIESNLPDKVPVNPLSKPIAIPQIDSSFDSPILRAFPPELTKVSISERDWLDFCDGLNIALIASPPLQVVDMAGIVIGFVPHHWAIIAGAAIQTAAQTTIHILSKTLTDKYLLHANTTFFSPRGLSVRLVKTPALRQLLNLTATPSSPPSRLTTFGQGLGRVAENVALRLPIIRKVVVAVSKPAPEVQIDEGLDMTGRRLKMMEDSIAELSLNVPAPREKEALMDKASDLSLKLRKWKVDRGEKAADRKRAQLANLHGVNGITNRPLGPPTGLISGPLSSVRNFRSQNNLYLNPSRQHERNARRAERRARKDGRIGLNGRKGRKLEMKVAIADRKEWNATDSLVWLCVFDKEEDKKIAGREVADSPDDFEVDQEDWEEVIQNEDEEDTEELFERQKLE